MKMNWNFLGGGGGGVKQKTFCGGKYGYFLELHISACHIYRCSSSVFFYIKLFDIY